MKELPLIYWRNEFGLGINYCSKNLWFDNVKMSDLLHLFNLKNVSDEELEKRILDELWINLDNKRSIEYINEIYEKSISMYQEILLIELKFPFTKNRWNHFKYKSDFISFLRKNHTSSKKDMRQIYCDITKIMFCYNQIQKYPQMLNSEKYANEIFTDFFLNKKEIKCWEFQFDFSQFMSHKPWKTYFEWKWIYTKKMKNGSSIKIKCKLRFRWKTPEKTIVKILWSEKWFWDVDEIIKDSIGFELESSNKNENGIYLLEYLYFLYKKIWNINEFRQKPWFYSQANLDSFLKNDNLSKEFRDFLSNLDTLSKKNWNSKYQDCKFQWKWKTRNQEEFFFEARYVESWNKNQSGMSNSKIIDWKKLRDAIIWLRWWVSENYLIKILNDIKKDSDIKKNEDCILKELLNWVIRVNIPHFSKKIYSSNWRLSEIIANANDYPDFIVNAIKKEHRFTNISDIMSYVKKVAWKGISKF